VLSEAPVTSVAPRRSLLLCGSNRGTLRSIILEPLHRRTPRLQPPVFFPISGHQHAVTNLRATAPRAYKLSAPSTSLCIQASSAPTRTSDPPPESSNLGFPPNHSRTPLGLTSSWPTRLRSAHNLCPPVLAFLCALDTPRPTRLS
jgi:hypothetical protein